VQEVDPAVDAGSRGENRPVPAVGAGTKGVTRSLGAILFYPRVIDEDLGESCETTVGRLDWGIM
jgi:hypothetical protein